MKRRVVSPSNNQNCFALGPDFPAKAAVHRGVQFKWSILLFVAFLVLVCAFRTDAAPSVQILSGWEVSTSRSIMRTASGNIYAMMMDNGQTIRVFKSTNNGSSWTQQDATHAPSSSNYQNPSAAMDGNGIIRIAYWNYNTGLRYVTFSTVTDTFSGDTAVVSKTSGQPNTPMTAIAIDSNNASHIVYADGAKSGSTTYNTVTYIDNVGSTWNAKVQIYGAPNKKDGYVGDILIDQNNLPQITYQQLATPTQLAAAKGNVNKATSFTSQALGNAPGIQAPSVVLDSSNNTWIAYFGGSGTSPYLIEHLVSDAWSIWQTPVQDSAVTAYSRNISLAANGATLFIAYPSSVSPYNLTWQSYNGSFWSTSLTLDQTSVNSSFTSSPCLKWSQYFNNGGSNQIDILIAGPAGAYWNKITSTISGLSTTSGTAGTPVTISGSNFGSSQGASTVTFNGIVATPSSWSSTSITVNVPAAATTGPVVVSVGGAPSNPVNFTVLVPSISNLSVTSGPVGTPVTINGSNFGTSQGTSTITFNGVIATATSWSSSSIATSVPGGATSGPVRVTVNGVLSNSLNFTVTAGITNISPSSGTAGTSVTITGSSFGGSQGTSTVTFNSVSSAPTNWSNTQIITPVPATASSGPVVVTVGGIASNSYAFTVTPAITSISPTTAGAGNYVTITGTSFGATRGASTVTFNGANANPSGWSSTSVTVPVPSNATSGPVVVTVGGQASNGVTFTFNNGGTISGAITRSSDNGAVSGVFVAALQSGLQKGSATSASDGSYSISSLSPGSYDVSILPTGYPPVTKTGNLVSATKTTTVNFSVTLPTITSVAPSSGVVGNVVKLTGSGFGNSQGTSVLAFNGTAASPTAWNDSTINAPVPAGATSGPVVVTVGGVSSNSVTFAIGTGSASGAVSQAGSGTPISGALVELLQANTVKTSTTTLSGGTYSISNLNPGVYDFRFSNSGFGTVISASQSIGVGSATTVNASLAGPGTISGRITKSDGTTPIQGATVGVQQGATTAATGTTDSGGNYSVASLSGGSYLVQASATGYTTQSQNNVSVSPGNTTTANFSLSGQSLITYAYDSLGRLVGVSDSQSNAATYSYDPVGNLLSISTNPTSQISIMGFVPTNGVVGASVTINGTGFSAISSQDSISFNGTSTTVSSATTTQLIVTVPTGATTGPISVTSPAGSVTSAQPFTVGAGSGAPTISSFTPTVGLAGSSISISGTNFDPTPINDVIKLNNSQFTPTAATSTALSVNVPTNTASGHLRVQTINGSVVTPGYFFVPPVPHTVADVSYMGNIQLGGSVSLPFTAGKIALLVFDGTAGQGVSLSTTDSTVINCTVAISVLNPDGSLLTNGCVGQNGYLDQMTLGRTGTYTLYFDPGTYTGSFTVNLHSDTDLSGTITPSGPPVNLNFSSPGQKARLTWFGTSGQKISLVNSGDISVCAVTATIFNPDGTVLWSQGCMGAGGFIDQRTLSQTGTFTIYLNPNAYSTTGLLTVQLWTFTDPTGSITPSGSPVNVQISTPGQKARLTWNATAGQEISLQASGSLYVCGPINVWILKPDGSQLANAGCNPNDFFLNEQTLPQTGTYTVYVDPQTHTGNLSVQLWSLTDIAGSITIGGAPVNLNFSPPGQTARLTFTGTAGQQVTAHTSNSTYSNCGVQMQFLNPDGSQLAFNGCMAGSYNTTMGPVTLGTTGTYTVYVSPGETTGSFALNLTSP